MSDVVLKLELVISTVSDSSGFGKRTVCDLNGVESCGIRDILRILKHVKNFEDVILTGVTDNLLTFKESKTTYILKLY